ncbi:MAG: lipid-A-disaccharide synthase [Methylococcaceae bacterium]
MTPSHAPLIMFSAGETSGDQHASAMFYELKKQCPTIRGIGMGSTNMAKAGISISYDSAGIAVIGVIEVLKHYKQIKSALKQMQTLLKTQRPDLLVCVDYKEFNFKLARYAKSIGIKVLFYVSPQVWAWREGRVKSYGKVIDKMAVIFPFETAYYEKENVPVRYVGHPCVDKVKPLYSKTENLSRFQLNSHNPIIGLLAGSRAGEIKRLLPVMLKSAEKLQHDYPQCQFILPQADSISDELLRSILNTSPLNIKCIKHQPYDVIQCCDAVMTCSGTASLEIALLTVPMLICYKLSPITYYLGRLLIKTPFIGLPNIVAGKKIINEFIQAEANADNLATEIARLLSDKTYANTMRVELERVKQLLGEGGGSKNMADLVLEMLQ